jgi:type IV pilus assembly protein PilM
MASTALGIDIGSRTITMAEVKGGRGNPTITNFGGVELPVDCTREGEVLDVAATAVSLKELIASTKVRGKDVHLGVANQRVVVRQLDLLWVEPKELKASLRYQVQEHLPIPVEDAELDVHVVEEYTNEAGQRYQRLLLVAAHRDMVSAHVEVAQQAGLKPISIDLNPFAALRAIGATTPGAHGNEVVIDVGGGVTDIVVHDAGIPTFVRILALGGDDITSALAAELQLSPDDAETRKRQLGIDLYDTSDPARQVVNARAARFVEEIRSSLDYYQAQPGSVRLANVVLTGGGALLPGLVGHLADKLRLSVEVGSVFDRWPVKGTVYGPDELGRVGPNLAVPVGLALGGLG